MQCPNFNSLTLVSLLAAIMSLSYSTMAFGASVAHGQVAGVQYNLDGYTAANGVFGVWNALGTVLFAYGGHNVVLEIQARPLAFQASWPSPCPGALAHRTCWPWRSAQSLSQSDALWRVSCTCPDASAVHSGSSL